MGWLPPYWPWAANTFLNKIWFKIRKQLLKDLKFILLPLWESRRFHHRVTTLPAITLLKLANFQLPLKMFQFSSRNFAPHSPRSREYSLEPKKAKDWALNANHGSVCCSWCAQLILFSLHSICRYNATQWSGQQSKFSTAWSPTVAMKRGGREGKGRTRESANIKH